MDEVFSVEKILYSGYTIFKLLEWVHRCQNFWVQLHWRNSFHSGEKCDDCISKYTVYLSILVYC